MKRHRYYILFIAVIVCVCTIFGQESASYNEQAEKRFVSALGLFKKKSYTEADMIFSELLAGGQVHQRTTASYVMSGKAKFHLGKYSESIELLHEFVQKFPETEYRDDAYYTLGLNQFMLHHYPEALTEFTGVLDLTKDKKLFDRSVSMMKTIADQYSDVKTFESLFSVANTDVGREYISLLLAERLYEDGKTIESRRYLNPLLQREKQSRFSKRIIALSEKLSTAGHSVIGVLLPLMRSESQNPVKEFAEDVYAGIDFALQEWKKEFSSGTDITLDAFDTGTDSATGLNGLQKFAEDGDVVGVIGPLFSDIALACAPVADKAGLPLISPTASTNALASERTNVFQANPDVDTRARAVARYMVQELGYQRVAALADSTESGKILSEEFAREAQRLGASVLAVVYYHTDSSDLRNQFLELRRQGTRSVQLLSFTDKMTRYEINRLIRAGADETLLDAVRKRKGSISVTDLFGPRGVRIADSLRLKVIQPEDVAENLDIPLSSIQGLFVPISDAEHVGVIASQIRYFNIQTQLFGSGEWYDLAELDEHKRDADGVMFVSDSYIDEQDSAYTTFTESYKRYNRKRPTKYTLYGYDTMNFLLHQMSTRNISRAELTAALKRSQPFKGIHGYISLNSNRVNSYLHILQYVNGKVQKIGEIFIN